MAIIVWDHSFDGVSELVDCSSAEDTGLSTLQAYEAWLGMIARGARLAWLETFEDPLVTDANH